MFKLLPARMDPKQFYFNVLGKNFQVFATSETYKRRQGAINAIRYLIELFSEGIDILACIDMGIIKIHQVENRHWFTIHGKNGLTIVTSEAYTRGASVNRALYRLSQALLGVTEWIDETKLERVTLPVNTLKCPKCKQPLHFEVFGGMRIVKDGRISAKCPPCKKDYWVNAGTK